MKYTIIFIIVLICYCFCDIKYPFLYKNKNYKYTSPNYKHKHHHNRHAVKHQPNHKHNKIFQINKRVASNNIDLKLSESIICHLLKSQNLQCSEFDRLCKKFNTNSIKRNTKQSHKAKHNSNPSNKKHNTNHNTKHKANHNTKNTYSNNNVNLNQLYKKALEKINNFHLAKYYYVNRLIINLPSKNYIYSTTFIFDLNKETNKYFNSLLNRYDIVLFKIQNYYYLYKDNCQSGLVFGVTPKIKKNHPYHNPKANNFAHHLLEKNKLKRIKQIIIHQTKKCNQQSIVSKFYNDYFSKNKDYIFYFEPIIEMNLFTNNTKDIDKKIINYKMSYVTFFVQSDVLKNWTARFHMNQKSKLVKVKSIFHLLKRVKNFKGEHFIFLEKGRKRNLVNGDIRSNRSNGFNKGHLGKYLKRIRQDPDNSDDSDSSADGSDNSNTDSNSGSLNSDNSNNSDSNSSSINNQDYIPKIEDKILVTKNYNNHDDYLDDTVNDNIQNNREKTKGRQHSDYKLMFNLFREEKNVNLTSEELEKI